MRAKYAGGDPFGVSDSAYADARRLIAEVDRLDRARGRLLLEVTNMLAAVGTDLLTISERITRIERVLGEIRADGAT